MLRLMAVATLAAPTYVVGHLVNHRWRRALWFLGLLMVWGVTAYLGIARATAGLPIGETVADTRQAFIGRLGDYWRVFSSGCALL